MKNKTLERTSQFFREEYRNLVRFVRSLIEDAADRESEDIVQDVALHIFEKADVTAPIEHLSSYIYQALRNRTVDYFRRKKDQVSLETPLGDEDESIRLGDTIADQEKCFSLQMEDRHTMELIFDIVNKMDIKYAAVFIATEIDDISFRELAEEWNVPIGTLLSLKSRAVKKIREQLTGMGIVAYGF